MTSTEAGLACGFKWMITGPARVIRGVPLNRHVIFGRLPSLPNRGILASTSVETECRSPAAVAMPASPNARLFYRAAKQRFEDAEFLLDVERTTAAIYLAGYSVECILKALILAIVPRAQEAEILAIFRGSRAHDYDWLLRLYAESGGAGLPPDSIPHFARVNTWSSDMRYSPGTIAFRDAKAFLDSSVEIITWADGRLS